MTIPTFSLTSSTHPLATCADCTAAASSASTTARVTGSTGSTYTREGTTEHSATVRRQVSIFWITPASPVNGEHGTTDTALILRYPTGELIPVGVQTGTTALDALPAYSDLDGYTVLGVRRGTCNVMELPILA